MKQSKKYAVTGGIGSGKSAVCEILRKKGYAVFSCDAISRALWCRAEYRAELASLFPDCTIEGEIDKKKLSDRVFSDKEALDRLNSYAHPCIMEELMRQMEGSEVAFAEVPLLFENGLETLFDGVLAIRRGQAQRLRAVSLRDGLSESEIQLRMTNQFDPARYEEKRCFILENNGSLSELEEGVEAFLRAMQIS